MMKTVKICVGVVKRIRPKAEKMITSLLASAKKPREKRVFPRKRIDRFCVIPSRTSRTFYGSDLDVESEERFRYEGDRKDIRWWTEGPTDEIDSSNRIEGCSCEDIDPPVANLDEWACCIHDPRKEEKEDDHSHIREFVEGIMLTW